MSLLSLFYEFQHNCAYSRSTEGRFLAFSMYAYVHACQDMDIQTQIHAHTHGVHVYVIIAIDVLLLWQVV